MTSYRLKVSGIIVYAVGNTDAGGEKDVIPEFLSVGLESKIDLEKESSSWGKDF